MHAAEQTPIMAKTSRLGFYATICFGSFLLFLVQPMVARMALPRLGGAPTVWNSAMLVYQSLLLGGYAYAHWLGRFVPRRQAVIHLVLFAVAAYFLPVGLAKTLPPADASPFIWVPYLLLTSIGPLFFMVAAQAPLMQRWFTAAGGGDPYRLYAASNLGSFAGLIAYPLVLEPLLPVVSQSRLWSFGYIGVLLLVLICALSLPKGGENVATQPEETPRPDRKTLGLWILLAAVPSGLMLSTSLHLTTDIVAMPLLWVLPLGLYLLSFSIAFGESRVLPDFFKRIAPIILLMSACAAFIDSTSHPFIIAFVILFSLFVVSTVLHSEMFARRPHPEHLTRFYLAMSIGGVVGGLFCALLAPLIFDWTYEHPILIAVAAYLVAPVPIFAISRRLWDGSDKANRVAFRLGAVAILISLGVLLGLDTDYAVMIKTIAAIAIIDVAIISFGNAVLFAGSVIALMLALGGWEKVALSTQDGLMTRSYFGVYSVRTSGTSGRLLVHGTTVHGVQNLEKGKEALPTTYYAPRSGIGLAMAAAPSLFGPSARIGVVGLGAGTLSCYAKSGQNWRFYEIDPVMIEIASDPKRFTFLSRCLPHPSIGLGDARITLAAEAAQSADLLAIDAFSSDSVPMHLLTKEAFATYRRHLSANGLLMVHISNRYLDLEPVIAAASLDGWVASAREYTATAEERQQNQSSSFWIALSPSAETIRKLHQANPKETWRPLKSRLGFTPWTDDHATILNILKPYKRDK
jgi:spermidine synthase